MAEDFGENFRGGRSSVTCPYCDLHCDSQEQMFNKCSYIKDKIEVNGNYMNIFGNNIDQTIIKTITRISNFRKS